MATPSGFTSPSGRLGDPSMTLRKEPRLDARLKACFEAIRFPIDGEEPPSCTAESSIEELIAARDLAHMSTMGLYSMLPNELPSDDFDATVSIESSSFTAPAGNEIALHFFRPKALAGKPLPTVVYIHGGGMCLLTTRNKVHDAWCSVVARNGVMVVAVDFRNAGEGPSRNFFPAGLDDCCAAIRHLASRRAELGISNLVLNGESGGGNLSLASTLRAKQEGWLDEISGVYANIPFIFGGWGDFPRDQLARLLPSVVENNTYGLTIGGLSETAYTYVGRRAEDMKNPLAWPYYATDEMLQGLPPHVVVVDELDPLRDEGRSYYLRLVKNGVRAVGKMNAGVTHGSWLIFRQALGDVQLANARDVAAFAKSLAPATSAHL